MISGAIKYSSVYCRCWRVLLLSTAVCIAGVGECCSWRCLCGLQGKDHRWTCAMLGSVRLWVRGRRTVRLGTITDLLITAIILASTGVRSQHTWHPMRAPPWTSLPAPIAQPVRSEQDTNTSLLCQCLHTNIQTKSDDCCHQAEQICSDYPSERLKRLLWNQEPKFSSPCWAREDSCLPPVLSQTQINLIESDNREECRCVVEEILKGLENTNEEMKKSLDVLLSVHVMVDCADLSHCQTCKVSPSVSVQLGVWQ